jgi:succinoglycan biosynthesis protein ExoM
MSMVEPNPVPPTEQDRPTVTIAVPTFKRVDRLELMIPRLVAERDDLLSTVGLTARILIIDNDQQQSARAVVEAIGGADVCYLSEPKPGVVAVRNRALAEASADAAVIFIDDDELPVAGWLTALVGTWLDRSADAVAGPVVAELPDGTDSWIKAGGFFDRAYRYGLVTGDRIQEVGAGNLLLDLSRVRSLGLSFDEGFGLTGGEDSLFTRSLTRAGATIVWCAEAAASDPIPPHRATRTWVCQRAISSGNTASRVGLALEPSLPRRLSLRVRLSVAGALRMAGGSVGWSVGTLRGSERRAARSTRTLMRGIGMILGAVGLTYLQYARNGNRWQWTTQLDR